MHQGEDDDIRRKAYEIWESEGRPEGRHREHWRRAHETFKEDKGAAEASGEEMHTQDMHTQDLAMIPENSAERLTQTEPRAEPAPAAKRPRTQRRKTPAR
jgi:hypothetical protein